MKKKVLALSVAGIFGGLSTGAMAQLSFSSEGHGNALIVPYYSAQGGNGTVFSLVNTDTVRGKAVKVRFRGAANSDDVFDFHVYLSPGDVFNGTVTNDNGVARFSTSDVTCTAPGNLNQAFVTARLPGGAPAGTLEGYIEIFNMADIPRPAPGSISGTVLENHLFTRIKHVNGVAPCALGTARTPEGRTLFERLVADDLSLTFLGADEDRASPDGDALTVGGYPVWFVQPTGGLFANVTVLDVPEAASWSTTAAAVVPDTGEITRVVWWPQTAEAIPGAVAQNFTADPLLNNPQPYVAAAFYDLPDMSTPYTFSVTVPEEQVLNLTHALTTSAVINEYATPEAALAVGTDWVFTMPSRRYYLAVQYDPRPSVDTGAGFVVPRIVRNPSLTPQGAGVGVGQVFRAFNTFAGGPTYAGGNARLVGDKICVQTAGFERWDREEREPGVAPDDFVISPGIPGQPSILAFCGEASVISFRHGPTGLTLPVLSAAVAAETLETEFINGWGAILTPNEGHGLPVLGAAYLRAVSPNVGDGTRGNFGGAFEHRVIRTGATSDLTGDPSPGSNTIAP